MDIRARRAGPSLVGTFDTFFGSKTHDFFEQHESTCVVIFIAMKTGVGTIIES